MPGCRPSWRRPTRRSATSRASPTRPAWATPRAPGAFERAYAIRLELLRSQPHDPVRLARACHAGTRIGRILLAQGDARTALARLQEALPLCEAAWRGRGEAPVAEMLATTRMILADALRRSGDVDGAVTAYRALIADQETAAAGYAFTPHILEWTYDRLGQVLIQEGQLDASLPVFRKELALAEQIARDAPTVHSYRRNVAAGYENLADALRRKGDYRAGLESVEALQRAVTERETIQTKDPHYPDNRSQMVSLYRSLGRAHVVLSGSRGDHGEACLWYDRAIETLRALEAGEAARNHEGELDALMRERPRCAR